MDGWGWGSARHPHCRGPSCDLICSAQVTTSHALTLAWGSISSDPTTGAAIPNVAGGGNGNGSHASRANNTTNTNGRGNDNSGNKGQVQTSGGSNSAWGKRDLGGVNKRPPSPNGKNGNNGHVGSGRGGAGGGTGTGKAAKGQQYVRQGLPGVPMSNGFPSTPTPGGTTPPVPFTAPPTPGDANGRSSGNN